MIEELERFIIEFVVSTELNRLPEKYGGGPVFSKPKIGIACGDDPIYQKFKEVVGPKHLTPIELWLACEQVEIPASRLRIISIVFPYDGKIRKESNDIINVRKGLILPQEIYSIARNYEKEIRQETCRQTINYLKNKGYRADASLLSVDNLITKGAFHSNWSERHTAFAAGLGTFSLSDALISDVGCNIRLVSVITDAPLEATPRKSDDPYANCLFYAKGTCQKCVERCPYGCISENGHDRMKCAVNYGKVELRATKRLGSILKPHYRRVNGVLSQQLPTPTGCALCQFDIPCMDKNPMANEQ